MGVAEFFDTILPTAGLRCIAVPYASGKGFKHIFGDSNAWLAEATQHLDANRGQTVYHACASYKDTSSRLQTNVAYVRSFWADIDCGPGKPYADAREGARAVLAFALRLGLPRPFLISSGRGVHAYWPMDADMVPSVWKATARRLKAALRAEGVHADPSRTADEASVLRPPGTYHRKAEPRPVKIVVEGEVTSLAAFQAPLMPYGVDTPADDFLPAGGPMGGFGSASNSDLSAGVEYRPSSGIQIAQKCGIIQMIRDTGGAVDQPTWYFGLGVLAFTEESDVLCHEWSKGDPRYSAEETNRKLAQIRANQKPTSCEKLGEQHPAVCGACPFNGKIKTPYSLGLSDGVSVEVEEQVRTETGGWVLKKVNKEAPAGFRFQPVDGRMVMQHAVCSKDDEGEERWDFDTFCETLVMPITRLWIEGVAYVECEMDLKDQEKRRFLLEGGMIGKGKDTLAAELGRNEVITKPGKGNAMDSYLKTWMQRLKESADQVVAHRHFGWSERSFVLGDSVLHPDGSESRAVLVGMAKSKSEAIRPKGDLATWISLVDRAYNAPGQEAFQFLVASSFAAPLLSMMQQVSGVTVYAHSEGSGVGKTTAQRVGLSAWGDWDELMLADKKVTVNALWGLMGAYNSLPIVFDELTNTANDVASELVFSVSSGRSKQRMTAAGELRENNANWCTILQASGNNLLSEKLSLHRGNAEAEISRLFEFTLEASPHLSPNDANALFPQIKDHYGHAGRVYARHLVDNYDTIADMLRRTQETLNTQLGITQVERYWSALLAATLVAVALCRNLGLLSFDLGNLKRWLVVRLAENRVHRNEAANDPIELFGKMLTDLWEGVLVTEGEGDMRKGVLANVVQKPRGTLVGRAILPAKNEVAVLMLNTQAVKDWANQRGVSAREIFRSLVQQGWADPLEQRYSLGKGTVEYSSTSSYIRCWKLDLDKVGANSGHQVAQKFGVINGGTTTRAGQR